MFGTGDFFGALAAKRMRLAEVMVAGQTVGLVGVLVAAFLVADQFIAVDVLWGALGGSAGFVGVSLLYRGLARGPMGVVAPLTAINSAAVPAMWGVIVNGDTLGSPAWIGVGLALAAVALVSWNDDVHTTPISKQAVIEALLAGTGFGFMFIALAQTDPASAPWAIVGARGLTASVLLTYFLVKRRAIVPGDKISRWLVVGVGLFDTFSNAVFLVAAEHGSLTVVAVLTSLYPIATVVLAGLFLHERLTRPQTAGFVAAMLATGLIASG